jgi:hypothetical protein
MNPVDLPKSGTIKCDIKYHWIDTYLDLQNITIVNKRISDSFKDTIIQHYRKEILNIWNL